MKIHLTHRTQGADARPIGRTVAGQQPVLQKVILESHDLDGHSVVHLSPDQALYVHSRLAVIIAAFLHGHQDRVEHLATAHLPDDVEHHLRKCGARVWPISSENGTQQVLEQVVVASDHPDGNGVIHLSPEQVSDVYHRLTRINLAYLHENTWGGEDARGQ